MIDRVHTVLVVEDNPITRKLLRVTLAAEGYRVLDAADGATAIRLAATMTPDVIVLDLILPDINGIELLRRLRCFKNLADVPAIACTGFTPQGDDARIAAAGFAAFLLKPVEPSKVVATVATYLQTRGDSRQVGAGKRVLVVDDDDVQLKLSRLQLEAHGFTVRTATDGAAALDDARRDPPDAILADVMMPRMDGFRLCLAVRQDQQLGRVPVVLQSSKFTDDADRALATRVGANAYVMRSGESTDVVTALTESLNSTTVPPFEDVIADGYSEYLDRVVHQLERQSQLNAGLVKRYSQLASAVSVLGAASEALASNERFDDALSEILYRCIDAAGISAGLLYVLDDDGTLRLQAAIGSRAGNESLVDTYIDAAGLLERALNSAGAFRLSSDDIDGMAARGTLERHGLASAIAAPVTFRGEALGVILLGSRSRDIEGRDWLDFASVVSGQFGQAVAMNKVFVQLRERNQQFSQLADNIKEVFFVVDAQFRETVFVSPAYERVSGRTCKSAYENAQSLLESIVPSDRDAVMSYIAELQRGGVSGDIEYSIVHTSGETRRILAHAVGVRNEQGEIYRIVGTALDITDRKRAEDAVRLSEERFRALVERSGDAIALLDAQGIVTYASLSSQRVLGVDSRELVGRDTFTMIHPDDVDNVRDQFFALLTAPGAAVTVSARFRHQDGSWRRGEGTLTNRLEDPAVRAVVVNFRDVTEQHTLEQQFRQVQKMEAIGRLAGGVAHDFNNLLTVIHSYTDFLSEDLASQDPRRQDLDEIRKAATAASSLTRQLLAFSRQEVIQPRAVVLQDVVASTEKMLRRLIGEDITLTAAHHGTPLTVTIDPGQFEQVIMNLAVNARDAMPKGGQLTIETGAATLDADYASAHWPAVPGTFAVMSVSDTGVGMDDATRARIFEPFFTTKDVGKGTGLGLATVYGIVKQCGGFIWVYSELARGTTFKVYLPVGESAVRVATDAGLPPSLPHGTETVLLAEDAPVVRTAVRRIVERLGYTVLEAPSATAALDIATRRRDDIHLLITDIVMPEMSGRELAEKLAVIRPTTKLLYMSGYTDDAVVRHGVLSAGVPFLQKPFTSDALARKIREVLDA